MKKFVAIMLVVFALVAFSVSSVGAESNAAPVVEVSYQDEPPPAGEDVALPVDLETLIQFGVALFVTQGLKSLSKLLGKDISGWTAVLTASIASSVIFFFNALLSAVPDAAEPSVAVLLTLIVTILGSFGLKDTIKGFQSAGVAVKK